MSTRDWLWRCSPDKHNPITLDDLPEQELERVAKLGFDWLWLLGVWQTGEAGRAVSRSHSEWQAGFEEALPGLRPEDIVGSPFAITAYAVHRDFGGNAALARFRERLKPYAIQLLLDFVPNHTALDHPWVTEHPDYYIEGTERDLAANPSNFVAIENAGGSRIFAYGRDPYFPGWPDTLQLNYANPALQAAMRGQLQLAAGHCDGLRCDMAMLLLPEVIRSTWGLVAPPFWPEAIKETRRAQPQFIFVAEVYWGLERELQDQGFDFTYDKTLYDTLLKQNAPTVRALLCADLGVQQKSVRFLENHDEPRVAVLLPNVVHRAAAVIALLTPGMRLIHDGQQLGFRRKPSVHLSHRWTEQADGELRDFYNVLLPLLGPVAQGNWRLFPILRAWNSNPSNEAFVAFGWLSNDALVKHVIAVNYSSHDSQCYVRFPSGSLLESSTSLHDRLSPAVYERNSDELTNRGLYLALAPWGYHLFEITGTGAT